MRPGLIYGLVLGLALVIGLPSCETEPADIPIAPYVTRSVLGPALEKLDSAIGPGLAISEPNDDDQDLGRGLIEFLNSAPPGMGDAAFEDAKVQGDRLIAVYVDVLGDESATAAQWIGAVRLTAAIGTPAAASFLLDQLESHSDASVRATCAWKIGDMGFDFAIPMLVKRLKYEKQTSVTPWLGSSLAKLGNFSGVGYMITVAQMGGAGSEADNELGRVMHEAGFEDAYELLTTWQSADPDGRFELPEHSMRFHREVWRLIEDLTDFQLRGVDDARFILSKLGKGAVPLMTQALEDENHYVRFHVAQALERMGERASDAGPALVEGLRDDLLAPYAAEALGAIGYPPAMDALLEATGAKRDPGLRLAAVRGLKTLADAGAADRLRELVAEADFPELAQSAAEGLVLCGFGDEYAGQVLGFAQTAADTGLDADTSLSALAAWARSRAEDGDERAAKLRDDYDALAPEVAVPPTREEDRARRKARMELFEEALPELLEAE